MAGPAYFGITMNVAKNEDWIMPFLYGTTTDDGATVAPIDLTGSTLKLEMRIREVDHEAVVSVRSPDEGIDIVSAAGGSFQINILRSQLARLAVGDYFVDLVRLLSNGNQERIFEGTATVVEGTTR